MFDGEGATVEHGYGVRTPLRQVYLFMSVSVMFVLRTSTQVLLKTKRNEKAHLSTVVKIVCCL